MADFYVARDDYVNGGTKRTIIEQWLPMLGPGEYIYAGPVTGYAGLALAYACQALGPDYKATLFMAWRKEVHERTLLAQSIGAHCEFVKMGRLSNVQAKAKAYAKRYGAKLLPWGLDHPEFIDLMAQRFERTFKSHDFYPREVWSVAGSGVLQRALQRALPDASFYAVNISGHKPNVGRATLLQAPEDFEQDARVPPPFPSCSNYDAKAWQFFIARARPGALYWNVAG